FFFQAEDGIRDFHVTGVQTCALPISASADAGARALARSGRRYRRLHRHAGEVAPPTGGASVDPEIRIEPELRPRLVDGDIAVVRSEERRVGKECRGRWAEVHETKTQR